MAQQLEFVNETAEAGFPSDRADQMTMLVLNRSSIVLPLLVRRVEVELRSRSASKALIDTATEMIAYAGDEHALRAIAKLISMDADRFGRLVPRALDNAMSFGNPFLPAYSSLDTGDEAVSQRISDWAESRLGSERVQRLWAVALVERYKQAPDESLWKQDLLVRRFKVEPSVMLKENVERFSLEAAAARRN